MSSRFDYTLIPPLRKMNLYDDPARLRQGECVEIQNAFVNEDGSLQRVSGITNVLTTSHGVKYCLSLNEFVRWDGSLELVYVYDDTLYQIVGTTSVALKSGLSEDKPMGYVAYNDYLYIGNGFDENMVLVPVYHHKIADSPVTTANAAGITDCITLANELATEFNVHIKSATYHQTADVSNTVAAAAATDAATLYTIINELKGDYTAHKEETNVHYYDDTYRAVEAINATNTATALLLTNEMKALLNQHFQMSRVVGMGVSGPTAGTGNNVTGTGLDAGAYSYVYTFYNTPDGVESAPKASPINVTATTASGVISLTELDISTDPQVTHKRIYRTGVGGAVYYRLDTITNRATTYSDDALDTELGAALETEDIEKFANCNNFILYNDRVFMAGDYTNPFRLYFSEPMLPWKFIPTTNFFDFEVKITALAKTPNGILVFEPDKVWFLAGTTPATFTRYQLSNYIGCSNQNGIAYIDNDVAFVGQHGVFITNGVTITKISRDVDTRLLAGNVESAALCFDNYNRRLYVAYKGA